MFQFDMTTHHDDITPLPNRQTTHQKNLAEGV